MNSAMINVWQKYIKNLTVRLAPGGSIENVRAIIRGDAQFGMTHTVTFIKSIQGGNDAFETASDKIRCVAALAPVAIQMLVPKDSTITGLGDLGDKRVGLGLVGALQNPTILEILKDEYGFTPESIVANGGSVNYLSDADVVPAIQDGRLTSSSASHPGQK
jgi:TRAP-type uncharacterized transport system substrate-binding protein